MTNHVSDEQWAGEFFAPLKAAGERDVPASECPIPPRIWRVASGLAPWEEHERRHLAACPRCRKRFDEFKEAIASQPPAMPRPAADPFAALPDTVPAIALHDASESAITTERWQLVVHRRSAVTDRLGGSGVDEQAEVAVLQRSDGVVEIGLEGFLLPQPGEQARVQLRSADGEVLGSGQLPQAEDILNIADMVRVVQDGDRLRITRSAAAEPKLEIDIEIRRPHLAASLPD